jgi:peptidoglycan/LPS O-acetylase OafA/YrhL
MRAVDKLGDVGVDIFFVLSGFLITTLLCRERDRTGRVSVRDFYIRRAFRILPAFFAYLLFVALLSAGGFVRTTPGDWVAALTYTMNFRENPAWELGHIWSLSIEEHFYLAWPLLFLTLPRRIAIVALVGAMVMAPALRATILLLWPAWSQTTELWTFTRLDPIAAGCLLALLARDPATGRRLDAIGRRWPLALALLAAGLVAGGVSTKVGTGITPSITAVTLAVLVWAAARSAPRWLSVRVLVVVGVGSYSLYLWQEVFLNPRASHWWTAFPQNLLLSGLAALASYRLVERPFLAIKDRFHSRSGPVSAPRSVPVAGDQALGPPESIEIGYQRPTGSAQTHSAFTRSVSPAE